MLRVYPGANGAFALHDDPGNGYGYEKGEYSLVQLAWNDGSRVLTVAARHGTYPGIPETVRLKIVCGSAPSVTRELSYSGSATRAILSACR